MEGYYQSDLSLSCRLLRRPETLGPVKVADLPVPPAQDR